MRFTDLLWDDVKPIRAAIHAHPFLDELAAGTLAADKFRHYIMQDSLYLSEFGRALSIAAAKAPTATGRIAFSDGAKVAVQVEEALHQSFFSQFGVTPAMVADAEPTPACLGYTGYLGQLAATGSYEELIAGVLPCYWIYWDVGCALKPLAASPNPYAAWIDTYGAPDFGAATEVVRTLVDEAAEAAGPATRRAMRTAFRNASRYEWMFWDSAWREAGWPV